MILVNGSSWFVSFPSHIPISFLICFLIIQALLFALSYLIKFLFFFHGVDYYFCFIGSCKFRCHSLHVIHIFCLKIRNPKKSINVNDCVLNGKRFGLINIVRRVLENIEMVNGNIHVLRIKICRSDVNFIGFKFSGFVSLFKCCVLAQMFNVIMINLSILSEFVKIVGMNSNVFMFNLTWI